MKRSGLITILGSVALLAAANTSVAAPGDDPLLQLLETVAVIGKSGAIVLNDDEPAGFDPLVPANPARNFADCDTDVLNGLVCLDNDQVRVWSDLSDGSQSQVLFDCKNPALPLNGRRNPDCSAIAVDIPGNLYIGGPSGNSNSLLRVFRDPNGNGTGCGASTSFVDSTDGTNFLCFETLATDRPEIRDIDPVESDGPSRLLVLEGNATTAFYNDIAQAPATIEIIAQRKNDYGLSGNEKIQNVAFLQFVRSNDATTRPGASDFFIVSATDQGRLLALNNASRTNGFPIFNLIANRTSPACAAEAPTFSIATDTGDAFLYATDRNHCQLHILEATGNANGDLTGLQSAAMPASPLSTAPLAPILASVSPGVLYDLEACFPSCALLADNAALLEGVQLASQESRGVLYRVRGLPHCSWIPEFCYQLLNDGATAADRDAALDFLLAEGVLRELDPAVPGRPAEALIFNAAPLLPDVIRNRFNFGGELDNPLPVLNELDIPPRYRAQSRPERQFRFNALFFAPEPNVQFIDRFTLEVDVSELTDGTELGCELVGDLPSGQTAAERLDQLLQWDVSVRVSEQWVNSFDEYRGTIVNAGCRNPTRDRLNGHSLFAVDLEMTPCPMELNASGQWVSDSDGECVVDGNDTITVESPDDAVFGKLYDRRYDEMRELLDQYACTTADSGAAQSPLSASDCDTLRNIWDNGKDKLVKALQATIDPKTSAGAQNFQSHQQQLEAYGTQLAGMTAVGPDPANRIGEQLAAVDILLHILVDKVLPSIPPQGWMEDDDTWAN